MSSAPRAFFAGQSSYKPRTGSSAKKLSSRFFYVGYHIPEKDKERINAMFAYWQVYAALEHLGYCHEKILQALKDTYKDLQPCYAKYPDMILAIAISKIGGNIASRE